MNSKPSWNNHMTTAILVICVTLSAWIFKKPAILNWYGLGAALEVLYMLPSDSWRTKNNTYDYYEREEVKHRYPKSTGYSRFDDKQEPRG